MECPLYFWNVVLISHILNMNSEPLHLNATSAKNGYILIYNDDDDDKYYAGCIRKLE